FKSDEIVDALITKQRNVSGPAQIKQDIEKIRKMYEKKGYYNPKIEYEVQEISRNEAQVVFKIQEGQESALTEIVFDGNKNLSTSELKKILTVKEQSWFWFIDESGKFTNELLEENRLRLLSYYADKGFIGVQVGAPKIDIEGKRIKVTYPIREGDRFQVRKVDVTGDLVETKENLIAVLETKPKTWFQRSNVANDIKNLTKLYNNYGYAYADVEPLQKVNEEHRFIDLTYRLTKGEQVTIEKIDITGNHHTREKVIRRSLAVAEGDQYHGDRIEASKKGLEGMEFFENVKIKSAPGSKPDLMNLTVDVMEKKTGSLTAGLGYSSQDGTMGNVNLKERNLLGLGIIANLKGELSGRKNTFDGSLTYPWLMDYPLSATIRGYKTQTKESYYYRDSDGLGLYFGYPVYGAWSATMGASRDSSKLTGFDRGFAKSVVDYYKKSGVSAEKFSNLSENAVSVGMVRDTRMGSVIPFGGSSTTFGARFSGFGGEVNYSRLNAETTYYQPLIWGAIMKFKWTGLALLETTPEPIPMDRRLLLGGISSIRGYQYGEVGPVDKYKSPVGGDRATFANVECLVPLIEKMGINGVAFVDAGNSWNVARGPFPSDIKAGVGVGIRWMSPMGPLRLEYGWKVSPEKGQEPGAMAIGMGQLF
ncbi:MAG: outer membrane protein assembly factor BamA, partial [Pseudomonadota bacterium]